MSFGRLHSAAFFCPFISPWSASYPALYSFSSSALSRSPKGKTDQSQKAVFHSRGLLTEEEYRECDEWEISCNNIEEFGRRPFLLPYELDLVFEGVQKLESLGNDENGPL